MTFPLLYWPKSPSVLSPLSSSHEGAGVWMGLGVPQSCRCLYLSRSLPDVHGYRCACTRMRGEV